MSGDSTKTVRPEPVEGPSFSSQGRKQGQGFDGLSPNGVRGKLRAEAPLAPLVWFKSGGNAEWLFEPADRDDLVEYLKTLGSETPVMALGLGSNMIVRDGGVPGVTVRLGKAFSKIERLDDVTLRCGGGASGILVSSTARDAGIAGMVIFTIGPAEQSMPSLRLSPAWMIGPLIMVSGMMPAPMCRSVRYWCNGRCGRCRSSMRWAIIASTSCSPGCHCS